MADFGDIASCLGSLVYLLWKIQIIWLSDLLNMNVPGEDFFQNRIVHTKFDIYVFITVVPSIYAICLSGVS